MTYVNWHLSVNEAIEEPKLCRPLIMGTIFAHIQIEPQSWPATGTDVWAGREQLVGLLRGERARDQKNRLVFFQSIK